MIIKIDTSIPGFLPRVQLQFLLTQVARVPSGGKILELGTFLGRATVSMALTRQPGVHIHTVDKWNSHSKLQLLKIIERAEEYLDGDQIPAMQKIIDTADWTPGPGGRELITGDQLYNFWLQHTQGIPDLTHTKANTDIPPQPGSELDQIGDFDLIFQDAAHDGDAVLRELDIWWPKLKPGGTLIIDDYNRALFHGQVRTVDLWLEKGLHSEVKIYENFGLAVVTK